MLSVDETIRLVIVEDHPLMRLGVRTMLASHADMIVVGEVGTGTDAINLCKKERPNVVVVDLGLPDMSGVAVIRAVKLFSPTTQFVVLTTYEGDEDIYQALAAGARAYVIKGLPHKMLVDAIRRVHSGINYLPEPVGVRLDNRTTDSDLSAQEFKVISLMSTGRSNREIGEALGITEATIKYHVSEILAKLEANDRTHAVVIALQRGILHL
ncbi:MULTISPECIES: response regulator transcription factor [Acidobacteriaceae]|uniref:response regulator n=1 Tax=Acidobacteriaceae TaxID=204434 RepID=UPI00131B569B|nr:MULTISPECIES: response regulator transcription factor [Acidobacteriaceae]MDW5265496.1 response regulator transcription factor [Edaphobacter sp.]